MGGRDLVHWMERAANSLFLTIPFTMQSIFDISDKEEDLYAVLNCVSTSSVGIFTIYVLRLR